MLKPLMLLFLLCGLLTHLSAEDKYVLTDTEGQLIECTLINYEKGNVRIKMDGQKFSLPLSRFSKASSRDVLDWAADRAVRLGKVRINISTPRRKSERDDKNKQIQHVNYSITIYNDSDIDIDGLEVEYKIYWLDGRVEVSDPFYFWIDQHEEIGRLNSRNRKIFNTASIMLKERNKRKDSAIGVWVRIYRNGQFLQEKSSPTGLLRRVGWRNMSLDAIF